MSTIGRMLFRTLLVGHGHYEDDPQSFSLWSYTDQGGRPAYKVCWDSGAEQSFLRSPFCTDQALMWSRRDGHTAAGKEFLAGGDTKEDAT